MKYIKNQQPITVSGGDDGQKDFDFKFYSWLVSAVHNNPIFGKGLRNIMQGAKIVTEVKEQKDAEYIKLEDDDYAKLKESADICQWIPRVAIALIPFHQALDGGVDKLPEKIEEEKSEPTAQ